MAASVTRGHANLTFQQIQDPRILMFMKRPFQLTPGGVPYIDSKTLHPKTFRDKYYNQPSRPLLWKRHSFGFLPAIMKWFLPPPTNPSSGSVALNKEYFMPYLQTLVPVELTQDGVFNRANMPLEIFLRMTTDAPSDTSVYLAQCPIDELPKGLQQDLKIPPMVKMIAQDKYSSSIWIGRAPTYTPFHRDPNDNVLVQLAGRKVVRLTEPKSGEQFHKQALAKIKKKADKIKSRLRGEEMMVGPERKELDKWIWGEDWQEDVPPEFENPKVKNRSVEAILEPGDALYIPRGWWHSVRGLGEGITGSVNWWFR